MLGISLSTIPALDDAVVEGLRVNKVELGRVHEVRVFLARDLLLELALGACTQLLGERPLDDALAEGADDDPAGTARRPAPVRSVERELGGGGTNAEIRDVRSTQLASALLVLSAVLR